MTNGTPAGRRPTRRELLRATAAVPVAAGLAGCSVTVGEYHLEIERGGDDGTGGDETDGNEPDGTETTDEPEPTTYPAPPIDEDCLSLDPGELSVEDDDAGWLVTDGTERMLVFEERASAEKAVEIIQAYGFDSRCFVARPDPPMEYWLVGQAPPSLDDASVDNEDCIGFDRGTLEIEPYEDGDRFLVVDAEQRLLDFETEEQAQRAVAVIEHFEFDYTCFVERPDAPMNYWLTDP